jgi:hypothetical protein
MFLKSYRRLSTINCLVQMESDGIFQKLRNGKTIDSHDPDAYK